MKTQITIGAAVLGLAAGSAWSQVIVKVGKRGLEATLVDSDMAPITDAFPRVNSVRTAPDGSGRRFVVDTEGQLYVVQTDGSLGLYADFVAVYGSDLRNGDRHQGFTSLAFHPDFATNGLFYTVHTENDEATGDDHAPTFIPPSIAEGAPLSTRAADNVVVEWAATDPAADVFAGTRREIMRIQTLGVWHGMGEIRFNNLAQPGDDDYGLLYIAMGDGEAFFQGYGGNDPEKTNDLQRLDCYFGKMLRIDPQGTDGPTGLYGIPASNPYANDGDPDTFGEIIAWGLRNPHRFMWDDVSGEMFIFDIGEQRVEEISVFEMGANFGWPIREGSFGTGGVLLPDDIADGTTPDGFTYPVLQFDHADARAIAGGAPCRGCGVPDLEGKMILGDIPSGRIFVADLDAMLAANDGVPDNHVVPEELQLNYNGQRIENLQITQLTDPGFTRNDLRFALSDSGQIYITNKHDGITRVLAPGPCRADVTTTNMNPGQPGHGEPDEYIDGADIAYFVESWLGGMPEADLTTDNINPGDIGYGVPDGLVTGADLTRYIEAWLSGCP